MAYDNSLMIFNLCLSTFKISHLRLTWCLLLKKCKPLYQVLISSVNRLYRVFSSADLFHHFVVTVVIFYCRQHKEDYTLNHRELLIDLASYEPAMAGITQLTELNEYPAMLGVFRYFCLRFHIACDIPESCILSYKKCSKHLCLLLFY